MTEFPCDQDPDEELEEAQKLTKDDLLEMLEKGEPAELKRPRKNWTVGPPELGGGVE